MPANEVEQWGQLQQHVAPLVQAYFARDVDPLAAETLRRVKAWAAQGNRTAEWQQGGRRLTATIDKFEREMDLAQSYAGNALSGFGNAEEPAAAARTAIRDLRGALSQYRDSESLRASLETLDGRLSGQALQRGIYG